VFAGEAQSNALSDGKRRMAIGLYVEDASTTAFVLAGSKWLSGAWDADYHYEQLFSFKKSPVGILWYSDLKASSTSRVQLYAEADSDYAAIWMRTDFGGVYANIICGVSSRTRPYIAYAGELFSSTSTAITSTSFATWFTPALGECGIISYSDAGDVAGICVYTRSASGTSTVTFIQGSTYVQASGSAIQYKSDGSNMYFNKLIIRS
jgi:hypothetical protein